MSNGERGRYTLEFKQEAVEIAGGDSHTSTATTTTGISSPKPAQLWDTRSEGKVTKLSTRRQRRRLGYIS